MSSCTEISAKPIDVAIEGEVVDRAPVDVNHADLMITRAARGVRSNLAKIAYYGWRIRSVEGWTRLGYAEGKDGEYDYVEEKGIARSTWYRAVKIGQALQRLSLVELAAIIPGKLDVLARLEDKAWGQKDWGQEARALCLKDLKKEVKEANKVHGVETAFTEWIRLPVGDGAKGAIETMLDTYASNHELPSRSAALELIVADGWDRPNVMKDVKAVAELVRGAMTGLKQRGMEGEPEYGWLDTACEVLDAIF